MKLEWFIQTGQGEMGLARAPFLKKVSQYHLCVVLRLINAPKHGYIGQWKPTGEMKGTLA